MNVFIINGNPTSGKSTFIDICYEINHHTMELSMVDFVKYIAEEIGWKGQKDEKGRKFLSDLKDLIENYDENIIYSDIDNMIDDYTSVGFDTFFINARSPKDIDYLKEKYNAITVFIDNPRTGSLTSNHADADVNNYKYDYTIVNSGSLEDLKELAELFLKTVNAY